MNVIYILQVVINVIECWNRKKKPQEFVWYDNFHSQIISFNCVSGHVSQVIYIMLVSHYYRRALGVSDA